MPHLISFTGLMSGLTMGLLSLDMMSLKVMKDGGTDSEKKHARRIIPIVKRHHLLLVTLLLGNAAAVEAMPIFLDRISDPITAILVSVTAVLIFGEYDFTCLSNYENILCTTMQSLVLSPAKQGQHIGIMSSSLSALSHFWFPIDNS